MGYNFVLFTDMKSHTEFRSVHKSVTLSDLERPSDSHYVLFHIIRRLLEPTVSKLLKLDPYCERQKCNLGNLVFGNV